ncbi:MAG: hypothetical protein RLZZ258_1018 [Actinomycetota bacterium]
MSEKFGSIWERISLRSKLTALSVALIGLLLMVSSMGTISLLRTYLLANTDTLLTSTAAALNHEDPMMIESHLANGELTLPSLPSDFYIGYVSPEGKLIIGLVSSASDQDEVPNLTGFTSAVVAASGGVPFEVDVNGKIAEEVRGEGWRMVAVPLTTRPGSLIVALPTNANGALLTMYGSIGLGFGLLLLFFSGFSIWFTISSALRPLNEVERTAKLVSAGDTSQRLIERPGNTEIARLNRALNSMLNGIDGAMQNRNATLDQMRRFVSDASHELRTPLVSVRGYAELYRMGALKKPEQIAEAMGRIESEAVRMTGLVESLLTLTRMDEGAAPTKTPTNLVSLAHDSAMDASVAAAGQSIRVIHASGEDFAADESLMANVDANAIRQVFTNLLANASRFSPADGSIEIVLDDTAKVDGKKFVIIDVRDHGEGIPEQLRDKVFERFYRVDNSRNSETGGSGLGLAIVSSIVKRHGGNIVAIETEGGGATFRVSLPA